MELLIGTNVREYGQHIGKLAGFELDPVARRVRRVIISDNAQVGSDAVMRPYESVLVEPGEIDIRPYTPSEIRHDGEGVILAQSTRIIRDSREVGRVIGIDAAVATGELEALIGRRSWWTRRTRIPASDVDISVPGEARLRRSATQAA